MNYSKNKISYINIILGVILPALITVLMLFPLFIKPGYIFHGDEGWYFYSNISKNINFIVYAWHEGPNTSNSIPFYILSIPLLLFGSYFANHALTFLLAFLPGVTSFFSILYIFDVIYGKNYDMKRQISALIGSTFYMVNWQNYGMTNPMLTWSFSYIILPILTYLFFKIYKEMRIKDIVLFSMISMFGNPVPDWMYFISIEISILLLIILILNLKKIKNYLKYITTSLYLIIFSFLANSYSLMEVIYGFIFHAGGAYTRYGNPVSEIQAAKNESFYHLIDVIMFGQPTFNSFGINPRNWTILNIFIIMSAIFIFVYILIHYLYNKKIKFSFNSPLNFISYFILLLFISLFLAKGFNPPFGFIYKYVILLSPPGIVGITLDVQPWYILSALSYTFIFSIGLYEILIINKLDHNVSIHSKDIKKYIKNKKSIKKILSIFIVFLMLFLALFSAMQTTNVEFESYTYQAFSPKFYPEPYIHVTNYVDKKSPNAYVTWVPSNGAYQWEDNYSVKNLLSNLGGDLSPNFVCPNYIYPYLDRNNVTNLSSILSIENVRYLVLDESGQLPNNLNFNKTFNFLLNQTNISLVYKDQWLYVFKNNANMSLVSRDHTVINNIKEINPVDYKLYYNSNNTSLITFKKLYSPLWSLQFNGKSYKPISINNGEETGFILPKGSGNIIIYYELQTYFIFGSIITLLFMIFALIYFKRDKYGKK